MRKGAYSRKYGMWIPVLVPGLMEFEKPGQRLSSFGTNLIVVVVFIQFTSLGKIHAITLTMLSASESF